MDRRTAQVQARGCFRLICWWTDVLLKFKLGAVTDSFVDGQMYCSSSG
jgi:hypothetical protein